MKYIATISGGKDSVTMCDLLLKNGYPVDYIIFSDTLREFDEMYEYLDKVEAYFKRKYGIGIVKTNPKKSYREHVFHRKTKGTDIGAMLGLANPTDGFCEWRKISKIEPIERWAKNIGEHKVYIGITLDETHRCKKDTNEIYPLIEYFKMRENDCKHYLIDEDIENPLYRHFTRTGCANCQYKSDRDWYMTWKYYPKVWEELKSLEQEVSQSENVFSKNCFLNFRKCADMEKLFKKMEKQGSLFDLSDEPLKDCFCKI